MNKYLNICNLYIFLWCLYSLQGTLYASGSIISQGILAILLAISLFFVIYANAKFEMPPYMKVLNLVVVVFTIYGVVLLLSRETFYIKDTMTAVSNKDYLKNIYMSMLPIYTFFTFVKIGILKDEVIRKWVPIFILVAIAAYFENQNANLATAEEIMSMQEEFSNNTGYMFLAIIPLLFFVKKPFVQYLLLLICGVFIIAAMKRGAILIFALSLPLFIHSTLKTLSFRKKTMVLLLIIGSVLALLYYVSYKLSASEYFQTRLNNTLAGDASGRESMYPHLLRQIFYYATPLQFLFGRGAWGTLKVSDNFAHNDWLEIGINQGVLGIVVYIAYWIAFYITIKCINNTTARSAVKLTMFIFFLMTMFSMSYDNMPIYATIVIGYCMANYKNNNAQYAKNNMLYR